jgi:hypothetical protein
MPSLSGISATFGIFAETLAWRRAVRQPSPRGPPFPPPAAKCGDTGGAPPRRQRSPVGIKVLENWWCIYKQTSRERHAHLVRVRAPWCCYQVAHHPQERACCGWVEPQYPEKLFNRPCLARRTPKL